ncbi:MAG: DNA alkylation repair protein [Betaproteobacteria bacterium]|nr:DNA alkylation repair protein [Betaproteobacteria bacterium]
MSVSLGVGEVLARIGALLRPLADAQQAAPMRAYMRGQFAFLGIRATSRRQALRGLPSLRGWDAKALLALADALWTQPEREFQYVAVDLLGKHHRQLGLDDLPHLQQLVQSKSWWDTVDGLAGVVGDMLRRAQAVQPGAQARMDAWLTHADPWVRRVAMLHQLGWREQTDEARLLRDAMALAPEKDFFIRKAIGWALRDHARTRPEAVRDFLARHADRFSGLTLREAGKHL